MPLITSPIDGAPMRQVQRYGIEFDVCPTTGGVWLDKGELEKLIALVKEEELSSESAEPRRRRGYRDYDDDDDDDYNRHRRGKRSRLSDIFDF